MHRLPHSLRLATNPALLLWLLLVVLQASLAAKQPNVVIILADDQGWGDLSVNGNTNLSTPNIGFPLRQVRGAIFDRFLCLPGLFAHPGGVFDGQIPCAQRSVRHLPGR